MGLLRCGCGLWVSRWRLVRHGSWVMALSSPVWVVGCGSWIDVDRGGSAGLELVALVGFWIGVDHDGSWWIWGWGSWWIGGFGVLGSLGFFFFFGCFYDWCYVYPNYKTVGLGSYLGSQSICFVGFWISYCEWSYARQAQICFYFLTPFTLPHWITLLFSLSIHSIFLVLFPEFPHLLFIAQY